MRVRDRQSLTDINPYSAVELTPLGPYSQFVPFHYWLMAFVCNTLSIVATLKFNSKERKVIKHYDSLRMLVNADKLNVAFLFYGKTKKTF